MKPIVRLNVYETQVILYLILAQLIQNSWIANVIRIYVVYVIFWCIGYSFKHRKELLGEK